MIQQPGARQVDFSTRLYFGFGGVASGVNANGFSYLLLFFYSQVIGLPANWVSIGIMLALLIDAVSDPVIGHLSDNLHSRYGRRHPFMYASGLPVAIAFYLLWSPPHNLSQEALYIYFIAVAILVRTLMTFYEIPATALIAELTDDYDERTSLVGFRYFFGWWGALTMAIMAYLVFLPEDMGGLEYVEGYRHYGIMAGIVMLLSIYVSTIGTHKHIPRLKKPPPAHKFDPKRTFGELKETLSNRSFLVLFLSALLSAVASGISTSLSIYFNRHFWEFSSQQIGYINIPYFGSAFLALLLAPRFSRWLGKKHAGILIMATAVLMSPLPLILRLLDLMPANGTDALFYTLLVFNALEVTVIILSSILVSAMIADVVEDSEVKTGRRSEGIFFAANSFAQKAVNGLGVMAAGKILSLVNFPTGAKPGEIPPDTVADLAIVYIPTLMIFYISALAVLTAYRISREGHQLNLDTLAHRKQVPE